MTRVAAGCTFLQRELQANSGVVALSLLHPLGVGVITSLRDRLGGRKQASIQHIRAVSAASRAFPPAAPSFARGTQGPSRDSRGVPSWKEE
jgi:hypothetical protein